MKTTLFLKHAATTLIRDDLRFLYDEQFATATDREMLKKHGLCSYNEKIYESEADVNSILLRVRVFVNQAKGAAQSYPPVSEYLDLDEEGEDVVGNSVLQFLRPGELLRRDYDEKGRTEAYRARIKEGFES